MKVYVLANIKDGGEIRGVYLSQRAASNNMGMTPRGAGFDTYEVELNVDRITEKYQKFILTILTIAESEGLTLQSPGDKTQ